MYQQQYKTTNFFLEYFDLLHVFYIHLYLHIQCIYIYTYGLYKRMYEYIYFTQYPTSQHLLLPPRIKNKYLLLLNKLIIHTNVHTYSEIHNHSHTSSRARFLQNIHTNNKTFIHTNELSVFVLCCRFLFLLLFQILLLLLLYLFNFFIMKTEMENDIEYEI